MRKHVTVSALILVTVISAKAQNPASQLPPGAVRLVTWEDLEIGVFKRVPR